MREYNDILAENLYLKKELADKERIINNYRAVFGEKDQEIIETTDKAILKNWYKDYITEQGPVMQEVEEPKSWFSKLVDKIYAHLPQWIFVKE